MCLVRERILGSMHASKGGGEGGKRYNNNFITLTSNYDCHKISPALCPYFEDKDSYYIIGSSCYIIIIII